MFSIPSVQINWDFFLELGQLPFPIMLLRLFLSGGWVAVLFVLGAGFWSLWVQSRQAKYGATLEYIMLAIDVPRENEQTPKAVEQIFTSLSAMYSGPDWFEKYWKGISNPTFSFEIVSDGGYVQYMIRTPKKYRDFIEASIYAQYPDAEIVQVTDYTEKIPSSYPHPEWDAFGTEFVLKKADVYPLRTYVEFEHSTAEAIFKDPLSPLLEAFSVLRPGEVLALQWLLTPTDDAWQKKGEEEVNKMLGKTKKEHKGMLQELIEFPGHIGAGVLQDMTGVSLGGGHKEEKKEDGMKMLNMSPGERRVLELMQMKLSKPGLSAKLRILYAGRRDVFNKGRLAALKGALHQFAALNMNALKGYGAVTPKDSYFWQKWSFEEKKSKIVSYFKKRSGKGGPKYVLNTEELATLWHFPIKDVKAPLIKKTESKRAEPPTSLPTEDRYPSSLDKGGDNTPSNLPIG